MRALTLLYHDVVANGDWRSSGFPGGAADSYKLDREHFAQHLSAVSGVMGRRATVHDLLSSLSRRESGSGGEDVLLAFDDGGASAAAVADLLEDAGWRGHFFITTDYIDTPGFVTRAEIRDLHQRGHVIGSHSCSHPERMASCAWPVLVDEWRRSTDVLTQILGTPVRVASVPNGSFTRRVAGAATAGGVTALFTSEPTVECRVVDGCLVIGRFGMKRDTPARTAAALCEGARGVRLRQQVFWNLKKVAKRLGGGAYTALRRAVYS
ncbi:MAG TPA: polysaccharide deacetylase family protein [Gemmatimonadales bacterium]|nr:polysaccharide deacetylase family protein [Gemmatimonadales bacterium]